MKISRNVKIGFFAGVSVTLIMLTSYFYSLFYGRNFLLGQERTKAVLLIPEGATIHQVLDSLQQRRILHDALSFMFVARISGYSDAPKAGRYLITSGMTNLEVVRMLRAGRQYPVRLTFQPVRLKEDLADRLTAYLAADATTFETMLRDPALTRQYGFDTATIMAMFIPNTYELYWTTDEKGLMDRMKKEYDRFWTVERRAKAEQQGLTPVQAAVLASIVDAETHKDDEKPVIAGVYLNRLRISMPLQADPTLVFAHRDFEIRRVLAKHKEIDSPYNTYRYTGLPPGPINTPSIAGIEAVLNAQKHKYLYFCAKEDFSGYHTFAEDYADHQANAERYRRALNRAGIR